MSKTMEVPEERQKMGGQEFSSLGNGIELSLGLGCSELLQTYLGIYGAGNPHR